MRHLFELLSAVRKGHHHVRLGSFGCGALCPMLSWWIQLSWKGVRAAPVSVDDQSITWMELLPIVLASAIWGPELRGQKVCVHCDNTGAVAVVNSGYSRILSIMFFIRVTYQFSMQAVHMNGVNNVWTDTISWNNLNFLYSQVFRSSYHWDPLLEDIVKLLVMDQPDWTSFPWTQLFRNCLPWV